VKRSPKNVYNNYEYKCNDRRYQIASIMSSQPSKTKIHSAANVQEGDIKEGRQTLHIEQPIVDMHKTTIVFPALLQTPGNAKKKTKAAQMMI
jgi:hypothetical protein